MTIAIHSRKKSFSDNWVKYCQDTKISYKLVNCYDSNIISELDNCKALMWHWPQWDSRAIQFARQLIYSIEHIGLKAFPNSNTCWHFDDKVGQKYLLESINAPLVKSYVFYNEGDAIQWSKSTIFPKVFKLRGGAGAVNVKLVRDSDQAKKFIKKAFSTGFRTTDPINSFRDRFLQFKRTKNMNSFIHILKGVGRFVYPRYDESMRVRDKGYVYFQDFIPNNNHDIRVIVIGERAFAIKRMVRKNDFRASGSGDIVYNPKEIPNECITLSFDLANKLKTQCIAFDYVYNQRNPMIVEISYGFAEKAYLGCQGYWDRTLKWHMGNFKPSVFIIEDVVSTLK